MIARSEITDRIPNRRHFAKRKYPKKWTHGSIVCQPDCGHMAKGNDPGKWTVKKGNESKKWTAVKGTITIKWTLGYF